MFQFKTTGLIVGSLCAKYAIKTKGLLINSPPPPPPLQVCSFAPRRITLVTVDVSLQLQAHAADQKDYASRAENRKTDRYEF